jgi:hypothetical protein
MYPSFMNCVGSPNLKLNKGPTLNDLAQMDLKAILYDHVGRIHFVKDTVP